MSNTILQDPLTDVQAFAAELNRQNSAKRDFIADCRDIRVHTDGPATRLFLRGIQDKDQLGAPIKSTAFPVNDLGHEQLATYLDIPKAYYDRMRDTQHGLLDNSVHTWLDSQGGKKRMVRTLDGRVRAILSDRYRRIDNFELAEVILPELLEVGAQFRHLKITEQHMHIKAQLPFQLPIEIRPGLGDTIFLGLDIENSEVGKGKVSVLPMSLTLSCLNGATHNKYGTERRHVGARIQGGEEAYEIFSDEALEADDKALLLKVRDVVRNTASTVILDHIVNDMKQAIGVPIEVAPAHAVAELGRGTGLSENEETGILKYLFQGGQFSQYGLGQAVTRFAQDVQGDNYDRADDLEHLGGDILSMSRTEFGPIATAGQPRQIKRRRR